MVISKQEAEVKRERGGDSERERERINKMSQTTVMRNYAEYYVEDIITDLLV